jgi:hypothetical protein
MRLALLADWKLLVEHARYHQTHDLALARGSATCSACGLDKVTLLLAYHPVVPLKVPLRSKPMRRIKPRSFINEQVIWV